MFRSIDSMIDADEGFLKNPSLSTAGAVTVRDSKGRLVTRKVKVHRYVAGKRPKYASASESEDEEKKAVSDEKDVVREVAVDHRLRGFTEIRECNEKRYRHHCSESESEEEDDALRSARRALIREQMLKNEPEEILDRNDQYNELAEANKIEESDVEDESSDEDFDEEVVYAPRLKPVFVPKTDRITLKEEDLEAEYRELERKEEERRAETLKIVENAIKMEESEQKEADDDNGLVCDLVTDDENEEVEYEKWKLRELAKGSANRFLFHPIRDSFIKRIKRDREEREEEEKEKAEIERNRRLAEEGRLHEVSALPRNVVNKQSKGKYKYLQKYYHRGAFYLDKDDDVLKRDFAEPTLEDHFDKTVLPKVMQVKNFGMASRTKYTHLVDQDTTVFDSAWATEKAQVMKWHSSRGGGMKQVFDRPSYGSSSKKKQEPNN